ncbi:PREDICTED: transmembrane channel-like protein 3 isoform X2 [Vollenhovia emeryi]|uniref:transmembrane channel-like protein 3 isoform X2 n=1 Tax=Vollenhovia emeryi TaxID=411798 RepID=UPI0005F38BA5|nr:PREDICTED: transmembrane channel-like protein 3 isoform X2 [Vollenhovia emeryi]
MQQRHATQWQNLRKRRLSAPYDDITRCRSSIYTMSLGDTAISMNESGGQEQISENLTQHKEILSGIKQQPWPLQRKIKLVRQTKAYIRRHEDALQEKFVQSRSTRNIVARILLFQTKKWQVLRNGLINLQTWLVPWEVRIMEIKSHFGSAVASYFIFLRWLFYINLVIAVTYSAFVAIPKVLIANATLAGENKTPNEEIAKSTDLLTLLEFEGALKHSPFFYGWYTSHDSNGYYKLPLAYFVTNLVLYMYSFVSIILKMVKNSRLSILIEKEDEYVFSRKLFTVWNFMIDNPKTADDRTASIALGFKEAILEEVETQKNEKIWRIITIRIFMNVVVLSLFALSVYTVVGMAKWSGYEVENGIGERTSSNKFTFVISLIAQIFPKLFDILGSLEKYHPRKQLRVQLARIMSLNLLNLYSLITALFDNIFLMKLQMCLDQVVQCGNNLIIKQVVTLMALYPILNNVTHSYARKEIPEPTLPFVRQETCSLNPLDNDTLCKDFNDTNDYNNYNVSYGNYQYETSDMGNGDEFSTTPYEEQDTGNSRISFVKTFHVTSTISDATLTYILKNNITTSPFNKHTKFSSKINYMKECLEKICESSKKDLERLHQKHKKSLCSRLDHLCWETMVGQELTKLVVMDLIFNVVATLGKIFFRPAFVRVVNKCWCWKLEKHGDFKIAENILHLVYNQGIVWMGMFFSPGLTALHVFKLSILMYLRSWEVLTSKVPNKVVFRASRSNNFYFGLLLIMLFVSVSSIGYTIIRVQPSWHCGPFSDYPKIYNLATSKLTELPRQIQDI